MSKLGVGYSNDLQSEVQTCVKVSDSMIIKSGSPQAALSFNGCSSYTEVASELDVDLSANARIDLGFTTVDVGASIQYTHYVKETDYSKSFIFKINSKLPGAKLKLGEFGMDALTDEAVSLYKSSPKKFVQQCGDQFIVEEFLGASLYISTRLDFITRTEKDTFSIDSSWLLGPITNFLSLASEGLTHFFESKRASLSIAVLQKGGDIAVLQKTVPEIIIQDNGFGSLNCIDREGDIDPQIEECKAIMNKLFDYASGVFPNTTKGVVTDTYKINYKTIGIDTSMYIVPESVIDIRKYLKTTYDIFTSSQLFLNQLFQPTPEKYFNMDGVLVGFDSKALKNNTASVLLKLNDTLTKEIQVIINLDKNCYSDDLDQCQNYTGSIDLKPIAAFQKAYAIKSECGSTIYGPRYMLAIDENIYREDSRIPTGANVTKTIVTDYTILSRDEKYIQIKFNNTCQGSFSRDDNYDFIHAYKGQLSQDCAKIICPIEDMVSSALFEIIWTDTLI